MQPVTSRHSYIQQYNFGQLISQDLHQLLARSRLASDFKTASCQQIPYANSHHLMIISHN
jgi:hypothetical protein